MEKITKRSYRHRRLYRGFSLYNYQENRTTKIYDVEVVKIDLLNHIFTRRGSRLMMPSFGTSIPELVMEILDETTIDAVREELKIVVAYDPRVELYGDNAIVISTDPDNHSITAALTLRFIELDYVDRLTLNIDFNG